MEHMCNVADIFVQWYMSNMCSMLLLAWLIPVTSNVAHSCICISHICPFLYFVYMAYVTNVVDIYVSGTCLAVTCEVDVAVACISVYFCKNVNFMCPFNMLAVWAVFVMWQHICSVIYVKHVYSCPCHMVDSSDFISVHIWDYQIFGIYGVGSEFGDHICFWYIFGNNIHIAVGCILAHICKNIEVICPFSIMAVWLTSAMC